MMIELKGSQFILGIEPPSMRNSHYGAEVEEPLKWSIYDQRESRSPVLEPLGLAPLEAF
jgi:hypothetical protein